MAVVLQCTYCVTHEGDTMSEGTFTFRVDEELKDQFSTAAKSRDRTGAQLLRDFMRDYVKQQQSWPWPAWPTARHARACRTSKLHPDLRRCRRPGASVTRIARGQTVASVRH